MSRINTIPQLVELINTHKWRFTGSRPSAFGLMRDFEADDGSLVILIEGKELRSAIAWTGPNVCPFCEILIDAELYPAILQSLTDSSKCTVKGQKFICRTTRLKTPNKSTLLTTEVKINGKTYIVESFIFETATKGVHSWRHRTIGAGLYHEWGQSHQGPFEVATHSHDSYLNSMKNIIGRAAQ